MNLDPSKIAVIANDEAAERLLREHGMLDQCQPEPPFDTASLYYFRDGYHILAVNNQGHPNPEDNGYLIWCIGDGQAPLEEIAAFYAWLVEENRVPGTPKVEIAVL